MVVNTHMRYIFWSEPARAGLSIFPGGDEVKLAMNYLIGIKE